MQEIAVNKDRGSKLDKDTKHIAVAVLCDAKIVHFKMRLGVPPPLYSFLRQPLAG